MDTLSTTQTRASKASEMDNYIRENPTSTLLIAAGVGLALGIALRSLQSEPESRGSALLKDIQARLHNLSERASELASNGNAMVQDGLEQVRDIDVKDRFQSLGKRLRGIFG